MSKYVNYVIKDYTDDEFSNQWKPSMRSEIHEDNLEYIAEEIAEDHYNEDPCDPEVFDCTVGIKWNEITKWFRITAHVDIDFSCDEVETPCPPNS